jgi:hypothetical protein
MCKTLSQLKMHSSRTTPTFLINEVLHEKILICGELIMQKSGKQSDNGILQTPLTNQLEVSR